MCVQGNYVRFAAREEGEDDFCFVAGAVEENKGIKVERAWCDGDVRFVLVARGLE